MNGIVDEHGRALPDILVSPALTGTYSAVTAWIDTAFDGHLVFPRKLIEELQLESLVETEAIPADGSKVTLEAFVCYVDWFDTRQPLQVIANEGRFPLLGTGLLENRVLHINYVKKELSVD